MITTFSFKNRIALYYILSSALLIAVVFVVIYQIVSYSVNKHINNEIQIEVDNHLNEIQVDQNHTFYIQVDAWSAREHNTIDVNPVFVEFLDHNRLFIDKSPNLKQYHLSLFEEHFDNEYIDTYLNGKPIRQIQIPIKKDGKEAGHLILAMSLEDVNMVLSNLKNSLFLSFPLILVILFLVARFFAGRSIKPVSSIIETTHSITKDNLNTRIELPQNKDELYLLSKNINSLLDRIEQAIEREKQFTSDASHELRTPLAVIKGTLEVLIRKPREQQEYQDKITYCIQEVDRLNTMVDELLLLARFENQKQNIKNESIYMNALILDSLTRFSKIAKEKEIQVVTEFAKDFYVNSDHYLVSIIIGNILSNALKYSEQKGKITVALTEQHHYLICTISDNGIGIPAEDVNHIFQSFYRSQPSEHPETKGTGLGLSIVKRLCDLLQIKIELISQLNQGTSVVLRFNRLVV